MRVTSGLTHSALSITLLLGSAAPVYAQYVQPLPAALQQTLYTAAQQGPNQLLTAIYNSVQQYPQLAQAIVNNAARIQPGMGQSMADMANRALKEATRAPQPSISRTPTSSTTTFSTASAGGSGLSTGVWVSLGLAGAVGGTLAAVAGGGGGGTAHPVPAYDEFGANWGSGYVYADQAQNRGGTGSGVLVAVADTGFTTSHPDLSTKYVGGRNYSNTSAMDYDINDLTDGVGHGTFVAGIIAAAKNGAGTQGMAYDATILPIKIFDNSGTSATPAETRLGVLYAIAQGADIYNGSYGYTSTSTNIASIQTELDAYATAAAGGMIMVFSAGNDGLSDPYLPALTPFVKPANDGAGLYTGNSGARDYSAYADRWLAVVAIDEDGRIASYSNRCGVAAAWCIAAPGTNVYSTTTGGYGTNSGTSFAAPHVSGAAAMLMDLYPSLTPAQVVARLLATTTKTGDYADTITYGHGLLNMSSATAFVATALMPTSSTLAGPLYTLDNSQFQLASPFGDGLQKSLSAVTFKPVDSFDGAAISTSGSKLVASLPQTNLMANGIRRFGHSMKTEQLDNFGDTVVNWQQVPGNEKHDAQVEARVKTSFTSSTDVTIGYMDDPALGFGLMADGTVDQAESRAQGAFLSPYMSFAQDGVNTVASTKLGNLTFRAGSFTGHAEDDKNADAFGATTELSYSPYEGSQISLQAGFVKEGSTFLGSRSQGAFTLGQTDTTFVGVSARLPVAQDTELVGSYFVGTSAAQAAQGSLLGSFSGIQSDAFTLGVIQHNMLVKQDKLGLLFNQPLRVSTGRVNMSLPNGVDAAHTVAYTNISADAAPTGRELDVEAFYRAPLDEQTDLNASLMYRTQPGHVATADDEVQALLRWQRRY